MGDFGSWTGDVVDEGEAGDTEEPEEETNPEKQRETTIEPTEESSVSTNGTEEKTSSEPDVARGEAETTKSPAQNGSGGETVPTIKSVNEMETDNNSSVEKSGDDGTSGTFESDVEVPIPDSGTSVGQLAERDRRWKIMVWGRPGLFKTHFACTMPEPVALVDLEGKAQDTAGKFRDREIVVWEPGDFREAQAHLQDALEWLESYQNATGKTGTIVVDSMSLAWEWAQTAYKTEAYPMTPNEDVTLTSNLGNSQEADWPHIKGMHNSEFRRLMIESDFHICWTAGEQEDYERVLSKNVDVDGKPMTDEGEKNNQHKADSVLRARYDDERGKVGDLVKSNFTDNKFVGMKKPTFPKFEQSIEGIEEAEADPDGVERSELNQQFDLEVISGKPPMHGEI